jgi:glycosyltransferase involved in cell wall biosynthesis
MMSAGVGVEKPGHWVVVTTSYPASPGDPSGHFVAAEVAELRARGRRVTVLAPRVCGERSTDPDLRRLPAGDAFGWPGVLARLSERPARAFGVLRFVLAARRELSRLTDAERIVAHFVVPSAWPISGERRTRLEVVAHGSDVRLIERLPRPLRRLIARRLEDAEVRCVSHELRRRLERALAPFTPARCSVMPAPLALPQKQTRDEARAELGVARDTRLFVVAGRLLASKRADVALAALRLVPRALAVVVGDGPERERLERLFPEARFVGRSSRERTLTWIAAADAVVTASKLEGAPSVVREARALGTPVIARGAGDLAAWSRRDPDLYVLEGLA